MQYLPPPHIILRKAIVQVWSLNFESCKERLLIIWGIGAPERLLIVYMDAVL